LSHGVTPQRVTSDVGLVLHFDGNSWRSEGQQLPFQAISVASGADVYAIGAGTEGSIMRFNGARWSPQGTVIATDFPRPPQGTVIATDFPRPRDAFFYGIWGTVDGHIFVVGPQGAIYHMTF